MGLSRTSLKFMIKLHKELTFNGSVLTLGNQDIRETYEGLKSLFRQMDCPFREVEPVKSTSTLKGLFPKGEDFVHAETFFKMMGLDEYLDVDKFDYDKPKLIHDLNTPFAHELNGRFSLVVDGGTIEHVFDIRSAMENIVRALRVGGWAVHISPASNCMDHGFYSFSPSFFYEFYAANGFEDFRCYLLEVSRYFPKDSFEPWPYVEYTYHSRIVELLDESKYIYVLFVARKAHSCDVIQIPNQGTYEPATKSLVEAVVGSSPQTPSVYRRWVPKPLQHRLEPLPPLLQEVFYRVRRLRLRFQKKIL